MIGGSGVIVAGENFNVCSGVGRPVGVLAICAGVGVTVVGCGATRAARSVAPTGAAVEGCAGDGACSRATGARGSG